MSFSSILRRFYLAFYFVLLAGMAGTAFADPSPWEDPASFLGQADPAADLLVIPEVLDPNEVYRIEHDVPLGDGRTLFVTETFTRAAVERRPRRAVLFLSGSAFRGNHWSIPVDGYDGSASAAQRGFFAYTVDYLGVGQSSRPTDGREVTFEVNAMAMKQVLRYIRFHRQVPLVDVVGAGYGGSLAAVLAEDRGRVRSAVMTAMLYDVLQGGPLTDPGFVAFLESSPDGYAFFPGSASLVFTTGAPQEVRDYVAATQGGIYPTQNFLVAAYDLPFFDPSPARAPGLILFGRQDGLVGPNGVDALARDYGKDGALLVVNEQAGHAPRTESPAVAAWFWSNLFAFIDGDSVPCTPATCGLGLPVGIEFSVDGDPGQETKVPW